MAGAEGRIWRIGRPRDFYGVEDSFEVVEINASIIGGIDAEEFGTEPVVAFFGPFLSQGLSDCFGNGREGIDAVAEGVDIHH